MTICCLCFCRSYVNLFQLKLVEEYMKYHRVPHELRLKVRDYFYHRYHGRLFNESSMLNELSHVLEEVIAGLQSN